jgi:hypothetical protein
MNCGNVMLCVNNAKHFHGNCLHMQQEKKSDLFIHNMVASHV